MFVSPQLVLSRRDVEGVEMDTQSCMDHSILAIFEDSTVASEVRVNADKDASLHSFRNLKDASLSSTRLSTRVDTFHMLVEREFDVRMNKSGLWCPLFRIRAEWRKRVRPCCRP